MFRTTANVLSIMVKLVLAIQKEVKYCELSILQLAFGMNNLSSISITALLTRSLLTMTVGSLFVISYLSIGLLLCIVGLLLWTLAAADAI